MPDDAGGQPAYCDLPETRIAVEEAYLENSLV